MPVVTQRQGTISARENQVAAKIYRDCGSIDPVTVLRYRPALLREK
ncbi:MAG: hypothetical protein JRJ19_01225 [Deltaproteobacteria bacterium]|nr:hypothetical protein [Deltaproteobacteria bacterium]MBW1870654.1 hypothetical protein [Deltaproteobacteria bacterium]